jgi:hypothetical protein
VVNQSGAMKTPVESYVVRVYRRRSATNPQLAAVVEGSRLSGAQAFSNLKELWEILEGRTLIQQSVAPTESADESSQPDLRGSASNEIGK